MTGDLSIATLLRDLAPRPRPVFRVVGTDYSLHAYLGERLIGTAVRTGYDTWHVPLRPKPVKAKPCANCGVDHAAGQRQAAWLSVATRAEAIAALARGKA